MPIIPDDDQAASYWEKHSTAPYWHQMEPVEFTMIGDRRATTRITIRINNQQLASIKKIAKDKGFTYQTMIKKWLTEKLKQQG